MVRPELPMPPAEPVSPPTVLLVDDEPSVLSALRRLFRTQGYRIEQATSGADGLALLRNTPVDLVVSDMRMPGMDGAAFLSQVRSTYPSVVRILLTGYADISATIAAINQGAIHRYIAKPWDDNDLLLVVSDAIQRRSLEQENGRLLALTPSQNQALVTLNQGLEARVAERTAALESSLADLARRKAARLALDEAAQREVQLGALLHDIAKIGFDDGMLRTPVPRYCVDRMTADRVHPVDGEAALLPQGVILLPAGHVFQPPLIAKLQELAARQSQPLALRVLRRSLPQAGGKPATPSGAGKAVMA